MEYKIKFNEPGVKVPLIRISIGLDRYVIQDRDGDLHIMKYSDGGTDDIIITAIDSNNILLKQSPE